MPRLIFSLAESTHQSALVNTAEVRDARGSAKSETETAIVIGTIETVDAPAQMTLMVRETTETDVKGTVTLVITRTATVTAIETGPDGETRGENVTVSENVTDPAPIGPTIAIASATTVAETIESFYPRLTGPRRDPEISHLE